jgi:hypothetical protein
MGIYTNGSIFGVRIYHINDNDDSVTLFESKYDIIMSPKQKKEAYLFYENLDNKQNILFQIYTKCSSTLKEGYFMYLYPMSLDSFLTQFNVS